MKISGDLFYVFALMIPLAKANDYRWLSTVSMSVEQQCALDGHVGICSDRGPRPHTRTICIVVYCARGNGEFAIRRAITGTICGPSAVCHDGVCTQIPPDRIPREVGSRRSASCIIVPPRARA